jgi:hypothetical protein
MREESRTIVRFGAPVGRQRQRRRLWIAIAPIACALALGCAAIDHANKAQQYSGVPLSPAKGRGAERWPDELKLDETLASYVSEHGRPDYFYIVDRQKLYVFYTGTDEAAMFERVLMEPSQVTELGRIPGSLLKLLPEDTQKQVEARRAGAQRRAQTKARRANAHLPRGKPRSASAGAAAIPSSGGYIGGFEVTEIVARMRAPRTAADPGVSDWRESRVRGGTAYTARVGRTQYEVSTERVAFTVPVSASPVLPGSARLAIGRVNDAIFAAKADAVTEQMTELADRAVADRSGKTSFAQRVAGRTIRIGRRVDTGVFAYSVEP